MATSFVANQSREFAGEGLRFHCSIGKGGMVEAAVKAEGDGASPIGVWTMKRVFWRPDRVARPGTALPTVPLAPHDGWCDAPGDPLYNRSVRLPYPASHERLWREDHVYDLIVELDHNTMPVIPGRGSAIFLHLAKPDYAGTEGCIALALDDMLAVLRLCGPGSTLEIRG